MSVDEWDEFLSRGTKVVEEEVSVQNDINMDERDLGDFGDNAEVLMQISRGESLNTLLSSNGIWINSSVSVVNTKPAVSNVSASKKRSFKPSVNTPSVPVANSSQDLTRAITGHPVLSHPLSLLKQKCPELDSAVEVDSLGLFFYGLPGSVKIDSNVQDDMMKVIELKKNLLDKSIANEINLNTTEIAQMNSGNFDGIKFVISHENLKIISSSIPPNGKTNWLIPFTVKSTGEIDLSQSGWRDFPDSLGYFYEYCDRIVRGRIDNLVECSEHVITLDDKKILVKTVAPVHNVAINFRGAIHSDPIVDLTNFLFYRQSNYSIEIDFDGLKVTAVRSFVPKFDQQSRVFLLLRALETKLAALPEGNYLLKHAANVPFIKILNLPQQQ